MRVQAELWKDGFFDSQQGKSEWRATVVYEPLSTRYRVEYAGREFGETLAPIWEAHPPPNRQAMPLCRLLVSIIKK